MYRPPKVRPINLTIGGRYFFIMNILTTIPRQSKITMLFNNTVILNEEIIYETNQ